jgi:hypothetical protein
MGKPVGDVWIDDRAIAHDNWQDTMERLDRLSQKKK